MMVIPQTPNLKLVIAVFFFSIISVIGVSSYVTMRKEKVFFEHEKKLIINELSEMIDSYNSLTIVNGSLKFQLEQSKARLIATIDSINTMKPNQALIFKFKTQIKRLKIEKEKILVLVKNLESENQSLKEERQGFEKTLKSRDSISKLIESKYAHLLEKNVEITENKTLFVSNLSAEGAKRITSKNRVIDTRYASKTNKFHIQFTIVKNKFLKKGSKTFYFQIMDSRMNVISDKGTVSFDKKSLIYSGKKTINYEGEELAVSAIIDKGEKEELSKGVYYISIIYKGEIVSKTSMTLK